MQLDPEEDRSGLTGHSATGRVRWDSLFTVSGQVSGVCAALQRDKKEEALMSRSDLCCTKHTVTVQVTREQ